MVAPLFYNQGDQELYKQYQYLPQEKFRLGFTQPTTITDEEKIQTSFGIPATNAFTDDDEDRDGAVGYFEPYTAASYPSNNFITNRSSIGNTGFIRGTEPKETSMDKIGGLIKTGIGMAIPGGNFLTGIADNFSRENRLNAVDNAFIDQQLGIKEQSMHGGNLENQDRYGHNKVSMFGNYADLVTDYANKGLAKKPEDRTDFDNYYIEKQIEQDEVEEQVEFNNFINQRMAANKIRELQEKGIDLYPDGRDIHGGDGAPTTNTTTTSIGVSLHGGDSGSNIPDRNRARDRGRTRGKDETGQIGGAHHFRYGGLVSIL
tara:strand:- start:2686 stop:3636 length:951 start_codon:yes stop_codon:yes gene_type:complete